MSKKRKKVVVTTILLASVFAIACGVLFNTMGKKEQEKEKSRELKERVVSEEKDNPIDFKSLQEENTDIYAWIEIPETEVNAPVLQNMETDELYDEFYLDHLYNRVSGYSGALFTQKINTTTFDDANTVIYGHDMKNLEAFGSLKYYREQEYFDQHKKIFIYTPEKTLTYEIFAAVDFSDAHLMVAYNFSDEKDVRAYIDDIKGSEGIVDTSINVTAEDKLITLSTCIGSKPNNRYLVVAKLLDI